MNQILEQVQALKTPYALNRFINGKTVSIKREHPESRHFGKEVSLEIFDREEISAGKSRYQIARQPKFPARSNLYPKQRGDLMLLINGMPMFHIELKRSGIPVSQATNQIERYHQTGAFTGIFSLVQIFVAMSPEECVTLHGFCHHFAKLLSCYTHDKKNAKFIKWRELYHLFAESLTP